MTKNLAKEKINEIFQNYLNSISEKYKHEETSEMGYRADFEILLKEIFSEKNIRIAHDARAKQGNKPDFAVIKNDIPILYIEAKNIGVSLNKIEKSSQMVKYFGYTNLILTDYLEFRFYRDGVRYEDLIKIARIDSSKNIISIDKNYEHLLKSMVDFAESKKEPIKSAKHLAKIMGGKALRIRDNVMQFLSSDSEKNVELEKVYESIKKLLVHDLSHEKFADMYAQTLVYGLFTARYEDDTLSTFTRQEARDLIPKSNPFLRHFFDHIVGPNFDKRIEYIVNELCDIFSYANLKILLDHYFKDFYSKESDKKPEPVIHFYEDFLKEYDPELRKKMGAFYTPLPVVRFITKAVDYILEKEFKLSQGLANTSKINSSHRVQILDPAVGTGTFISAVIREIYIRLLKNNQKGRWPSYVHNDLLPRLHGFELMMTPYIIAHLKLSVAFKETGFKHFNDRLGIYLTNSLEESEIQENLFSGFGFAESIAEESKEATKIKNKTPIMVVLGNPPYSVSSSNKGEWIQNLIKVYKEGLNERKINLDDDYIKFIRFAEHFIEKNKTGIVAMITNNSFIDGITHRQMRKHLLETFDDIYILDLHGNSKKKEKAPNGGKDENVFNIQQGVSINIFIRKNEDKSNLGTVYHSDLYGIRENKFRQLNEINITTIDWQKLDYSEPHYFYVPKDFAENKKYEKGFKVSDLFIESVSGIESIRDNLTIHFDKTSLEKVVNDFAELTEKEIANKYNTSDARDWKISRAKNDIISNIEDSVNFRKISYRPFDIRNIYYTGKQNGFVCNSRYSVMKHLLKQNVALIAKRGFEKENSQPVFITDKIFDRRGWSAPGMQGAENVFPLYLFNKDGSKSLNLKKEIVDQVEQTIGKFAPENIFDYIYAVLHSPNYRKKYKEFLKIDFPRVPYPKDKAQFNKLAAKGKELRELHLMESKMLDKFITTYPEEGDNKVEKVKYENGKVYINETQYFGNVPELAWNFYIGGYQPAQKWLKDRKGRTLTNEDIEHYQKIIKVLIETEKIMKEIDEIKL